MVRAAIAGVSARTVLARALDDPAARPFFANPVHVIAAGKAAAAMAAAVAAHPLVSTRTLLAIGTHHAADLPSDVEWLAAAHPVPDDRSVAAGARALAVARSVGAGESLLLLLSGGASALMALPIDGLSLADKQDVIQQMLLAGADIQALNTVRKHLSQIKGGRLAAACHGPTLTLAISDVVGDDPAVIGSGPGVPDPTTWRDAADLVSRFARPAPALHAIITDGLAGRLAETPKPGDAGMARAAARVIASRKHALAAARAQAEALGYDVVVFVEEITGEARVAARRWFEAASAVRVAATASGKPLCVLSAGETTVHVIGRGRGGRNQEFALALVDAMANAGAEAVAASAGTDGIDGPTDAAGALVDYTTRDRAASLGLDASAHLADNNAYDFFATLGDLLHLGRTDTNVGDIQILLSA
jgi:hydroxypyruvate reductase